MILDGWKNRIIACLLTLLCGISYAQTEVRVMRIHYCDGATLEIPIDIMDSISFGHVAGSNLGPTIGDSISSNEVLHRAYLMASMEWTPLRPIPKRGGGFYDAGVSINGLPYSSVKEIDTYLFQNVSYHTFMTAVHNPKSLLYTVNISQPPYHGTNCGPYYGAVCSSSVMWALGIDIPYYTSQIISMPEVFTMKEHQEVDSLDLCDIIWTNGHVQMIYDIDYRDDTIYGISAFETNYGANFSGARIKKYSKEQFLNMWNVHNYVAYRYNRLVYSSVPGVIQEWDPIAYNDDLCPSRGDKSVYRAVDTVKINVFNANYDHIALSEGTTLVSLDENNSDEHIFYDLSPGVYSVFLMNEDGMSSRSTFEIIDTEVNCTINNENRIVVHFNSEARPEFAALCDLEGNSEFYPISDMDRLNGYIIVPSLNLTEYYCKVIFKGEYGRLSSGPIRVE